MSDNQRRACCRIAFLLLCAMPTALVSYWIAHPQTPESWEVAIKAHLGLSAQIDSVETPGPNVTILRGLELTDPDHGTLFKTVEARIEFGRVKNFVGIQYKVQGLTNQGLATLVKQVNRRLIRGQGTDKPWRLQFVKGSVVERTEQFPMATPVKPDRFAIEDLVIDVIPTVDGTTAKAYFRVPNSEFPDRTVVCETSKSEKKDQLIQFDTNQVPLPCWLIGDSVPMMPSVSASLGRDAHFVGKFALNPIGKPGFLIDGEFTQVDIKRSLRGIREPGQEYARIRLDQCLFVDNRPQKWDAVLVHGAYEMKIAEEDLFISTWEMAPGNAIDETIIKQGGVRSANSNVVPLN